MGNKQAQKQLVLPQPRVDHRHVYVLGDVKLACAMLRALVKHFRPSDDVDVVLSADTHFFSHQDNTSATVDVHVLLDEKSLNEILHNESRAFHLVIVLWIEDCSYEENQRVYIEQTYRDVTCLPMALWNLVLGYYSCEPTLDAVYRTYRFCRSLNVPLIRFLNNPELASHKALPHKALPPLCSRLYRYRGDVTTMHVDFETDKFIEQWQWVQNQFIA